MRRMLISYNLESFGRITKHSDTFIYVTASFNSNIFAIRPLQELLLTTTIAA